MILPSFLICSHWLTHTIRLSYWLTQSAHIFMLTSGTHGMGTQMIIDHPPLAQTDMYFVTFGSCNPTIGSHWLTHTIKIIVSLLLAYTVCTHSHALLLLVQLHKIVTTAHEQCAMTRGAGWEHNFCQFERGVHYGLP